MVSSTAGTVDEYIRELPEDRKQALTALRALILEHLPAGYEECMQYGMVSYVVPLKRYPDTHNKQPLAYISLASQKNYIALYLNCVYADNAEQDRFVSAWKATGKKLDMGKSCVRFKNLESVPLDVVADSVASTSVDNFIATYEQSRI
jgi:hypothetical protein